MSTGAVRDQLMRSLKIHQIGETPEIAEIMMDKVSETLGIAYVRARCDLAIR